MPQVSVTINGRQFRMACEDGEEAHLLRLAEDIDQRIARLRERFGEIGDTRLTVMAALTLADELRGQPRTIVSERMQLCRERGLLPVGDLASLDSGRQGIERKR